MNYPVGIIGGGAWGTALTVVMAQVHGRALIWARETEVVSAINETHENTVFLPKLALAHSIKATSDLADMADCGALLLVTPAQHLRASLLALPEISAPLILCAKGIEAGTQYLMCEIAQELRPDNPVAILSGPTFAHEVAAGKPTAITLATKDEALGKSLLRQIAAPHFRPYWTDDVIGAEIGGAVKNVLAIGCGVVDGAGRTGSTDCTRICRDATLWSGKGRQARNARRAIGAWRSGSHLFIGKFPQFFFGARLRSGQICCIFIG
jgi:glycerol-3-phosphate dehydrogenase (NAD(P)+)